TSTEAVLTSSKGSQVEILRLQLTGLDSTPRITGGDQLPGTTNYFIGNDPNQWHTNVPTYRKVQYSGVYRGIDLVYYGHGSELEYDFVVAPGADPNQIRLHFEGAQHTSIDESGDLVLETYGDKVKLFRPTVYQMIAGTQQVIAGQYVLKDTNEIG